MLALRAMLYPDMILAASNTDACDAWNYSVSILCRSTEHRCRPLAAHLSLACTRAGRYTKIGLLRKLLRETSRERAEWILWLDADTLLEELAFQLPMSAYDGKNFIAWGNADYLWAGDQFHGGHACVTAT